MNDTVETRMVYLLTYETRSKCWGGQDWRYGEWQVVAQRHSQEPPMERLKAKVGEETVRNLVLETIQETVTKQLTIRVVRVILAL